MLPKQLYGIMKKSEKLLVIEPGFYEENSMLDDRFERFKQMAKEEFDVLIVETDHSETSQMLLDELKTELKEINDNQIKK